MHEPLGALHTASTKDLIAALAARLTARLGQACGGQEDTRAIVTRISVLRSDLLRQVTTALNQECAMYFIAHPACNQEELVPMLLDILKVRGGKGSAGGTCHPRRDTPFGL